MRCNQCGRVVSGFFEHVAFDCIRMTDEEVESAMEYDAELDAAASDPNQERLAI